MRYLSPVLAGAAATALLLTACGGAPATTGAASTTGTSQYQRSVAFAACMRSHGEPSFPDPQPNGGFMIKNNSSLNPSAPQYQAAAKACAKLRGPAMSPAQRKQALAQALKYSACMRTHGVPSFPDPTVRNGSVGISISGSSRNGATTGSGIDPKSPQYQAAQKACQSLMPGAGGSS